MGDVRVQLELSNSADQSRTTCVEAVVDTGAMINWLPEEVVRELGLSPIEKVEVRYADGRSETRTVYGPITMTVEDRTLITDAVGGSPDTTALLSVVTLERLDLLVDPVERRLKPRHPDRPGPLLSIMSAATEKA